MPSISGQATGRYGAWVLRADYSTSPVSGNSPYFNVNVNLYFVTTGTATIQKNASETAYININGVGRSFSVGGMRGSGSWFLGSYSTTVGVDANGNCNFWINCGYNIKATLDGTYVQWIRAEGTGTNSGMGGVTPVVTMFTLTTKGDTTQTFNWNSNINSDVVNIQLNGKNWGDHGYKTGSTLYNLTPNTSYTLYARAHNGYGYGAWYGPVYFKTYPTSVSVSSVTIADITPFTCTVSTSSSDSNTTNAVEYSVYDGTGTNLIQGPYVVSPVQWIYYIENLSPETNYTIKVRVRTSNSNAWSDYSTKTFTTLTDQASAYVKKTGKWLKGKAYGKKDKVWLTAKKIYGKKNSTWSVGINN